MFPIFCLPNSRHLPFFHCLLILSQTRLWLGRCQISTLSNITFSLLTSVYPYSKGRRFNIKRETWGQLRIQHTLTDKARNYWGTDFYSNSQTQSIMLKSKLKKRVLLLSRWSLLGTNAMKVPITAKTGMIFCPHYFTRIDCWSSGF